MVLVLGLCECRELMGGWVSLLLLPVLSSLGQSKYRVSWWSLSGVGHRLREWMYVSVVHSDRV
jgi:hypothetical protein